MTTLMVFHEVDDVDHWLRSPRREEVFGPLGMTTRTFVDPGHSNRVGLVVEVPDIDTFTRFMQTEEAAEAMQEDGVRPETVLMLVASEAHAFPAPHARQQPG
jgi:hypothetical protein